jgi:hypothetical protein
MTLILRKQITQSRINANRQKRTRNAKEKENPSIQVTNLALQTHPIQTDFTLKLPQMNSPAQSQMAKAHQMFRHQK